MNKVAMGIFAWTFMGWFTACSSTSNSGTTPTMTLDGGPCTPDYGCTPAAPNTGDPHADCVTRVNQFRACACLEPLPRNADAEDCANQQAQHDSETGVAHSGFTDHICSPSGSAQNECPGYGSVEQTINRCVLSMFDEGPPPTNPCNGSCYQTYGHFINMTNTHYKSVACGFYTTPGGEVWQVQNYFQ